jgi:hypothetical protein
MPETESYNVLVIGSGEASKYLAWTMAKAGHRTAVVERRYIGGSCPNIACLPSQNVIHSAKVASLAARGAEFGVEVGPVTTKMKAVQLRKRQMVQDLIKVHLDRYAASGAELIMGEARFISLRTVEVSVMAVVQTAMLGRLRFTGLRDAIFTHPTAAEGLTVLLTDVAPKPITSSPPHKGRSGFMEQRLDIPEGGHRN